MKPKSARELLAEMVDLSVKQRAYGTGTDLKIRYRCVFCDDEERDPAMVQHKHMCIAAQAKDYLAEN